MFRYLLFVSVLVLVGCVSQPTKTATPKGICYTEPEWVLTQPKDNFIYGVGIAPMNIDGEQAQRRSAISKAINEIAAQLNTNVRSLLIKKTAIHNESGSRYMQTYSFQTIDGQKVSAKIIKSCKNPNNGYFYVLMRMMK